MIFLVLLVVYVMYFDIETCYMYIDTQKMALILVSASVHPSVSPS